MTYQKTRQTPKTPPRSGMFVTGSMVHGYREVLSPHMIVVMITTAAVVVVAFSLVGPVGTYHIESPLERAAYAALYTFICMPGFYALQVVVLYFLRFRKPIEILAGLAFAMLLGSFQCSAVMHTIESLTRPGYPAETGFLHLYFLVATSSLSCQILYFYLVWQRVRRRPPVAVPSSSGGDVPAAARDASAAATASEGEDSNRQEPSNSGDVSPTGAVQDESANSRAHPSGDEPAVEQANPGTQQLAAYRPAGQPGALLKLLPDRLGTDLIYIKSEDHYLEVHTTVGSSLVKMRFSEAVAELGERGIQVHRSYWVATSHVTRSVRSGKRTLLRLTGDHKVPVSVTHLPAVRAILARRTHSGAA